MDKKLFLSHSSEDEEIVRSFVKLLYSIGLTEKDIVCTSVPETKIVIGNDIYEYLHKLIEEEEIYVIYFLSDNYYSSPMCLNEMGAAWLKKSESLNLLLPGFDFVDIRGVAEKNKVGIKLGNCDYMTKASFNEFLEILKKQFGINPDHTHWEIVRDDFLQSAVENIRTFDMSFSRGLCIDDLENDGCTIIRKESTPNHIVANVDFNKTESKLCSIVVFNGERNFTSFYLNKKNLCFEAYANTGINNVDVELKLKDVNMPYEICLNDDEREYKIPLVQFCNIRMFWECVSEIKFVFHKKKVSNEGMVVIKNLRIE